MKIIYCHHSLYNPGGMERVMLNKIAWLAGHKGWDISIVTTNQGGRPTFYPLPEGVRMTDLGINYSDGKDGRNPISRAIEYLAKRRLHRRRLTELLMQEHPDVVVSLYPCESSFIPAIKDGSKKVLELHLSRFFRLQYGKTGLMGLINRWRSAQDVRIASRFDKFVVLTREDMADWGTMPNICVIGNASGLEGENKADCSAHRLIAVGRLDYQKSFDRLVDAWAKLCSTADIGDWTLDIFGQGEWLQMLQERIDAARVQDSLHINAPTKDIGSEYLRSSAIVMSSHYEGFPMVLVEAMSCGLPAVSFACKCGPRDLIQDGVNGLLVPDDDIDGLADAMLRIISDEKLRKAMSDEAVKVRERYSENSIMSMWVDLFESLV